MLSIWPSACFTLTETDLYLRTEPDVSLSAPSLHSDWLFGRAQSAVSRPLPFEVRRGDRWIDTVSSFVFVRGRERKQQSTSKPDAQPAGPHRSTINPRTPPLLHRRSCTLKRLLSQRRMLHNGPGSSPTAVCSAPVPSLSSCLGSCTLPFLSGRTVDSISPLSPEPAAIFRGRLCFVQTVGIKRNFSRAAYK